MNDDLATTVVIDSKSGKNGALSGGNTNDKSVVGKINKALNFDGTTDYVTVPYDAVMDIDIVSISLWFKVNTLENLVRIFSKRHEANNRMSYGIGTDETGGNYRLEGFFYDENANSGSVKSAADLVTGVWYHVVTTFDTNFHGKIYVNGKFIAVDTTTWDSPLLVSADDLVIASETEFLATREFDGAIDDVRVYNSVLTFDQIRAIYNNGRGTEIEVPHLPSMLGINF